MSKMWINQIVFGAVWLLFAAVACLMHVSEEERIIGKWISSPFIFHLRVVNACHMYVRLPFKNTIWLVSWNATLFIYFYFLLCFSFAKFVGWFWHLSIHIVSLCFMLFSLSFHKSNLFLQIKSINPTTTLTCLNRFKSNEFQVGSIVKVKHYQ